MLEVLHVRLQSMMEEQVRGTPVFSCFTFDES